MNINEGYHRWVEYRDVYDEENPAYHLRHGPCKSYTLDGLGVEIRVYKLTNVISFHKVPVTYWKGLSYEEEYGELERKEYARRNG